MPTPTRKTFVTYVEVDPQDYIALDAMSIDLAYRGLKSSPIYDSLVKMRNQYHDLREQNCPKGGPLDDTT